MFLKCIEWKDLGCFWGNVFINLLAIGVFCAIVLLIWKGLCWLDSWRWCKKQQRKTNYDSRNNALKEFTEALATLHQTIRTKDKKTELGWKVYLELKGELCIIRELTEMCFNAETIQKAIDDKVIDKILVYLIDLYVKSLDYKCLMDKFDKLQYGGLQLLCINIRQ